MSMELELKDRIIMRNQCKILSFLDKSEGDYWQRMATILERGYESSYLEMSCHFSEPFVESQRGLVIDVLDMYSAFEWAKKEGVKVPSDGATYFTFRGFDGNGELEYLTYARYVVETEGRFSDLEGSEFNSHFPMVKRYERMVESWKKSPDTHALTLSDFARIVEDLRARS